MVPFFSILFAKYVLLQIGLAVFAAYIDIEKNMRCLLKWMPKLILITIEEMALQIPITLGRLYGMLNFYWRRLVW